MSFRKRSLTSTCVQQLSPLDEAQVARPGPQSLGISKAEFGIEMICLQAFLPVDGVVSTGTMRAIHPDLGKQINMPQCEIKINKLLYLLRLVEKNLSSN